MTLKYEYLKKWRKKTMIYLKSGFQSKCGICGYDTCQSALDFHHLDPSKKEFNISAWTIGGLEKLIQEVEKCVLLCCRCHREVHEGIKQIPDTITRFSNSLILHPSKEKDTCKCGQEKSIRKKFCSVQCSNKERQKVDLKKSDLLNLLLTFSPEKIGDMYGISGNSIRKRMKRMNLSTSFYKENRSMKV